MVVSFRKAPRTLKSIRENRLGPLHNVWKTEGASSQRVVNKSLRSPRGVCLEDRLDQKAKDTRKVLYEDATSPRSLKCNSPQVYNCFTRVMRILKAHYSMTEFCLVLNRQPTKAHLLVNPPEALSSQLLCINPRLIERNLGARESGGSAVSTSAEATTATTSAATTTTTTATTSTASEATTAATATTSTTTTKAAATALLRPAAGIVQADAAGHTSVANRGTILGLEDLLGILNRVEADITEALEVTAITVES